MLRLDEEWVKRASWEEIRERCERHHRRPTDFSSEFPCIGRNPHQILTKKEIDLEVDKILKRG